MDPAHDFAQRRVFHIRKSGAMFGVWKEKVPETGGHRLGLQFFQHCRVPPSVGGDFFEIAALARVDMFGHEAFKALKKRPRARTRLEIHALRPRAGRAGCP